MRAPAAPYVRKPDALDEEGKRQIAAVLIEHPRYGHKRIALHLKLGHKRSRWVLHTYGLTPDRRWARHPRTADDRGTLPTSYPNLRAPLREQQRSMRSDQVWCTDCTYPTDQGKFIYLAPVIDVVTRQLVEDTIVR